MFGECCPFVVPSVVARAISITPDENDLKQTLVADNVAKTVEFNSVVLGSKSLLIDTVSGETTMNARFEGIVTLSLNVIREATGSGLIEWGVFIEVYEPQLDEWIAYPGSRRTISIDTQNANEVKPFDFTAAVAIDKGRRFRWRHYTNNASKQISLISFAASGDLPSSAAAVMSFWGVKS